MQFSKIVGPGLKMHFFIGFGFGDKSNVLQRNILPLSLEKPVVFFLKITLFSNLNFFLKTCNFLPKVVTDHLIQNKMRVLDTVQDWQKQIFYYYITKEDITKTLFTIICFYYNFNINKLIFSKINIKRYRTSVRRKELTQKL